jgi:excisionase family DNA binding protein
MLLRMSDSPQAFPRADWIDLRQASRRYPLSRRVLWRWIREGRLPVYRPFQGRKALVKQSDIEAILESARDSKVAP